VSFSFFFSFLFFFFPSNFFCFLHSLSAKPTSGIPDRRNLLALPARLAAAHNHVPVRPFFATSRPRLAPRGVRKFRSGPAPAVNLLTVPHFCVDQWRESIPTRQLVRPVDSRSSKQDNNKRKPRGILTAPNQLHPVLALGRSSGRGEKDGVELAAPHGHQHNKGPSALRRSTLR